MERHLYVDADITRAETLPVDVYTDPGWYPDLVRYVFRRSWQPVPGSETLAQLSRAVPFTLLEGCVDEPVVMTRDPDGEFHCLSNICTHRGAVLIDRACELRLVRCPVHGRRFKLDGRIVAHPRFGKAQNFPSEDDNLREIPFGRWGPFAFASLAPHLPFDEWIGPARSFFEFLPLEDLFYDPVTSGEEEVDAGWLAYLDFLVDTYHLPDAHPELAQRLHLKEVPVELHAWSSLQAWIAGDGQPPIALPDGHPWAGRDGALFRWWLFPNTTITLEHWGIVMATVEPLGPTRCRIRWRNFVWDVDQRGVSLIRDRERHAAETRRIVLRTWRGMLGSAWSRGRYSPANEVSLHHAHRCLARAFNEGRAADPGPRA